jgi:RNA polymerase sigma-70 factor (ECF subfamily)
VSEQDWLAERFESHRPQLRATAYRMLGSISEAEDAVQESWLRLSRSDVSAVQNLGGWLTTVVGRVCLDMLRSRRARREDPLEVYLPDPVVEPADGSSPEQQALLADSVGLALLVVLDTLSPAERLAFVLHDMFGLSFDEIAPIVDRTPATAMQLASRARRRVRGAAPVPDTDLARQRQVVEAYMAASRNGDFEGLLAVLDPNVVLRADYGQLPLGVPRLVRGAQAVTRQALLFSRRGAWARLALVNGAIGAVVSMDGTLSAVVGFTVTNEKIVEMDILADPERLRGLDIAVDGLDGHGVGA